ncbi:hypothetical protein [Amycolatopsis sp. NPDC098790]
MVVVVSRSRSEVILVSPHSRCLPRGSHRLPVPHATVSLSTVD